MIQQASEETQLKELISKKSDREIQEALLFKSIMMERHSERIMNNVVFFFWVTFVGLFGMVMGLVAIFDK